MIGRLITFRRHSGPIATTREVFAPLPPRKEAAPCCQAHALPDGRPIIGYCGPNCIRRPEVWRAILDQTASLPVRAP